MPQALNNLGSIARARRDLPAAIGWYRDVLAIAPDHLDALSNLGAVLVENGQADEAEAPLLRALRGYGPQPEVLCNLALVRIEQKRHGEADALLRDALKMRPGYSEAVMALARGLQERGQGDTARPLLTEAVAHAPQRAELWSQLGALLLELDDMPGAEQAFAQALKLDPR